MQNLRLFGSPILVLFAVWICVISATIPNGEWEKITTSPHPAPRSRPAVANYGSSVFLHGGVADTVNGSIPYNDTWLFDTETGQWTELQVEGAAPPARFFAACVRVPTQDKFIIFGGGYYEIELGTNGGVNLSTIVLYGDMWEFDLSTLSWTRIYPDTSNGGIPMPTLLGTEAVVKDFGNYVYLWGGIKPTSTFPFFGDSQDLYRYEFATNTMIQVNVTGSVPEGGHHACIIDKKSPREFIIGFRDGAFGGVRPDFWLYNTQTREYTLLNMTGDIPSTRQYFTGATFNNLWFGYGGDIPSGSGGASSSNTTGGTFRFDTETFVWTELEPSGTIPPSLKRHRIALGSTTAFPANKKMVLVGGFSQNQQDTNGQQQFLQDTYIFRPFVSA